MDRADDVRILAIIALNVNATIAIFGVPSDAFPSICRLPCFRGHAPNACLAKCPMQKFPHEKALRSLRYRRVDGHRSLREVE
jgi:hypothetical protein